MYSSRKRTDRRLTVYGGGGGGGPGDVSVSGGVSRGWEGVCVQGGCTPPQIVDRMTDAFENITPYYVCCR